jgi:hypothetical protein
MSRRSSGPSASRPRSRREAPAMADADGASGRARVKLSRRAFRTAIAHGQKSSAATRWIVERSSVAWTMLRSSSARVTASRSSPATRDHSPTYIAGAYCAWRPPIRRSAAGTSGGKRSSKALPGERRAVELGLREGSLGQRRRR